MDALEPESAYWSELDSRLTALFDETGGDFRSIVRRSRGAFPTVVRDRLQVLGFTVTPDGPAEADAAAYDPELHVLDCEWYFEPATAAELASRLAPAKGVLCLGAPTVAAALGRSRMSVTLVDRNPLVDHRHLAGLDAARTIHADLSSDAELPGPSEAVFFDAPWYPAATHAWLVHAARSVAVGGVVMFVALPPLTRPSARGDRASILDAARMLGNTTVYEEHVVYDAPLFERIALAEAGIDPDPHWRRADLVVVTDCRPDEQALPAVTGGGAAWERFVIGSQVAQLRSETRGRGRDPISEVSGVPAYTLPTVSRRDPRVPLVDLWTSRNRVAAVGHRPSVRSALAHLADSGKWDDLEQVDEIRGLPGRARSILLSRLSAVLGRREES